MAGGCVKVFVCRLLCARFPLNGKSCSGCRTPGSWQLDYFSGAAGWGQIAASKLCHGLRRPGIVRLRLSCLRTSSRGQLAPTGRERGALIGIGTHVVPVLVIVVRLIGWFVESGPVT